MNIDDFVVVSLFLTREKISPIALRSNINEIIRPV